jgi:hypothetical protein
MLHDDRLRAIDDDPPALAVVARRGAPRATMSLQASKTSIS